MKKASVPLGLGKHEHSHDVLVKQSGACDIPAFTISQINSQEAHTGQSNSQSQPWEE